MLVDAKANVNLVDNAGTSPVYTAVENSHIVVLEMLVKARADVNLTDDEGISPVLLAASNNNVEILRVLFAAGANMTPISQLGTPYELAESHSHVASMEYLRSINAD